MNGVMILSKPALEYGFKNERDKKNTAIHEFVHLIDKEDGDVDGIPNVLLERQYAIPWLDMIRQKIDQIYEGGTGINPYGGTNRAEFFAVVSEYFFERPRLFKRNHPKLYDLLKKIFKQDLARETCEKSVLPIRVRIKVQYSVRVLASFLPLPFFMFLGVHSRLRLSADLECATLQAIGPAPSLINRGELGPSRALAAGLPHR